MKVVYCLTDASLEGGLERSICIKANYLADVAGYDVTIITTDKKHKHNFYTFSPKIDFIHLNINYRQLENLPFFKKFSSLINKFRIHKQNLNDILLDIRPDIAISTYTHELTMLSSIKDGSKKIVEHHFNKSFKKIEHSQLPKYSPERIIAFLAEKRRQWYVRKYDSLVVLTKEEKKLWKRIKNVEIIPNVVPFYPSLSSKTQSKTVISVGRLSYEKGFSYLLRAWQIVNLKYPDWKLNIYGDGSEYNKLIGFILNAGLKDSVKIYFPLKEIEEEYINSSLFAMASLSEGFGISLTEAMACGLPCISFNSLYGPSEIITHGEDGLLVKYKSINKLAEAIMFLIEDNELRKEMGENAKINVKRFLPERIMPRWISLFEKVSGRSNY